MLYGVVHFSSTRTVKPRCASRIAATWPTGP